VGEGLVDGPTYGRSEIAFVGFDITTGEGLMSTLEAEMEIKNTVQATEAVEIIDCGRASERTQGITLLLLFELGIPPNDRLLI
jgi:hypothetical protein